jgi:hypothetical protein
MTLPPVILAADEDPDELSRVKARPLDSLWTLLEIVYLNSHAVAMFPPSGRAFADRAGRELGVTGTPRESDPPSPPGPRAGEQSGYA